MVGVEGRPGVRGLAASDTQVLQQMKLLGPNPSHIWRGGGGKTITEVHK